MLLGPIEWRSLLLDMEPEVDFLRRDVGGDISCPRCSQRLRGWRILRLIPISDELIFVYVWHKLEVAAHVGVLPIPLLL